MPERMPEKVQEKMPDRISDRLSHEMSEYMSYRMAAYLSLFLSHQLPVSGDHSKNSSEIHLVVSLPLSAISLFMCMHGLGPRHIFRHVSLGTVCQAYFRHVSLGTVCHAYFAHVIDHALQEKSRLSGMDVNIYIRRYECQTTGSTDALLCVSTYATEKRSYSQSTRHARRDMSVSSYARHLSVNIV